MQPFSCENRSVFEAPAVQKIRWLDDGTAVTEGFRVRPYLANTGELATIAVAADFDDEVDNTDTDATVATTPTLPGVDSRGR